MKKFLIIGGLLVSAYWIGWTVKNEESENFLKEKAMAECEETWASKGGGFIYKHGPIRWDFEPRSSENRDFEMRIRSCDSDWLKKTTVAKEWTSEFINRPCHDGYRYLPAPDASKEEYKAAECYPGDSASRTVKTWSWETK